MAKEANHNHQRNINVKTGLTEEQVLNNESSMEQMNFQSQASEDY
ncbi:MAG: hypothetical protein ACLRQX_06930 [Turicibacter sanguinis]